MLMTFLKKIKDEAGSLGLGVTLRKTIIGPRLSWPSLHERPNLTPPTLPCQAIQLHPAFSHFTCSPFSLYSSLSFNPSPNLPHSAPSNCHPFMQSIIIYTNSNKVKSFIQHKTYNLVTKKQFFFAIWKLDNSVVCHPQSQITVSYEISDVIKFTTKVLPW